MSDPTTDFDPDAPSEAGSGIFGLSGSAQEARVHILGIPFDATTSYRRGTAGGPQAILAASHQVDLFDLQQEGWGTGDGRPWAAGIHFELDEEILGLNDKARRLAEPIIEQSGMISGQIELETAQKEVNRLGLQVNERVHTWTQGHLADGRLPVLLGGDHSVPFGGIQAAAQAHPGLGILHFDAHADLRPSYEGFRWSHASVMWNVLEELPQVAQLLSVGLRDVGEGEVRTIQESHGRIKACFAHEWASSRARGQNLVELATSAIAELPDKVWLSMDIDGLDPSWCPNTGTPVPGGLTWEEALIWLGCLVNSGRQIVGLDLCEVCPGPAEPGEDSWDSIVGARLLYKGIGAALASLKSQI